MWVEWTPWKDKRAEVLECNLPCGVRYLLGTAKGEYLSLDEGRCCTMMGKLVRGTRCFAPVTITHWPDHLGPHPDVAKPVTYADIKANAPSAESMAVFVNSNGCPWWQAVAYLSNSELHTADPVHGYLTVHKEPTDATA